MSNILLSVLIPSVPGRIDQLKRLFDNFQHQLDQNEGASWAKQVEILCLLDNKKRSIGFKREALVQTAQGRNLAFCDDDDSVANDYLVSILPALEVNNVDVVVFKQQCVINNEQPFIVDHDIDYPNDHCIRHDDGRWENLRRKPWHHNVWRSELARTAHFPDLMWGEDHAWCEQLWPKVRTQWKIDKVLHYYRHNIHATESKAQE
jgi:hypothetical protein